VKLHFGGKNIWTLQGIDWIQARRLPGKIEAGSSSERPNRATFVTHTDQWPMPSCLTTAKQQP
jgi:hypothetical protein